MGTRTVPTQAIRGPKDGKAPRSLVLHNTIPIKGAAGRAASVFVVEGDDLFDHNGGALGILFEGFVVFEEMLERADKCGYVFEAKERIF